MKIYKENKKYETLCNELNFNNFLNYFTNYCAIYMLVLFIHMTNFFS